MSDLERLRAERDRAAERHHEAVLRLQDTRAALQAVVDAMLPPNLRTPTAMAGLSDPWPQAARALWPSA